MKKTMETPRFWILAGMIVAAAMSRLIPHPPNFAPIGAMALFGGAYFQDKRLAFAVPFISLFLSDAVLELTTGWGFYSGMQYTYLAFAVIVVFGLLLRSRVSVGRVGLAAVGSSIWFFLSTNFAVWLGSGMYAKTFNGLMNCYAMALPFFHWTLISDLAYCGLLFGGFVYAGNLMPALLKDVRQQNA